MSSRASAADIGSAPSIGLEYRVGVTSAHVGGYPTVVNAGQSLERSSFYGGASYINDFERDGWGHGVQLEVGFRLVAYEGFFARRDPGLRRDGDRLVRALSGAAQKLPPS